MNRKDLASASQQGSQPPQSQYQQSSLGKPTSGDASSTTNGHSGTGERRGGNANGNGNGAFYDASIAASSATNTSYPSSLSYGEQPAPASHGQDATGLQTAGSYDTSDGSQYLYTASAAAAAAAAAVNVAAVNQAAAASVAQNPSMTFASQVTPGIPHNNNQATDDDWRAQQQQATALITSQAANPWDDWSAAINGQTDRYSANALLHLGAARASGAGHGAGHGPGNGGVGSTAHSTVGLGDGSDMGMAGPGVGSSGTATPQAGQWPLLLFNDNTPSVSNP